jgi:hypothetical protein
MSEHDPQAAHMRLMLGVATVLFVVVVGGMWLIWHLG